MYHLHHGVVLAIKNVRLIEYNGNVISTLASAHLFIYPSIKETQKLKSWFEKNENDVISSITQPLDARKSNYPMYCKRNYTIHKINSIP